MDLQVYGMRNVMEQATTHIAVDAMSGGKAAVQHGNVAHLVGADASMNSAATINTPEAMALAAAAGAALPLADVATNYDTQFLRFSARRPDMRILFTVTRGLYHIVARRSAGIASVKDLRGKRVGTYTRTSAHYHLFKALEANGLRESDVEIVALAPIFEISKALIDKRVDAIAIWEPASQAARDGLGADGIELNTPSSHYFNLNTTTEKLADSSKRRQMVELTRHIVRASKLVKEKPQIGCEWLEKASGFDRELIDRSFHYHDYCACIAPDQLDVMAEQDKWIAQEQGRAPRSREALSTLLDYSVYHEAVAGM